jgi:Tfp pilus assembly protein FimV
MTTIPTIFGFRQAAITFYSICLLALSGIAYAETPEEALAQLVKDIRLMTPTMAAAFADGRYITKKGDTLDRIIAQTMDDTPVRREILMKAIVLANPHAFKRKNPNWMYADKQLKLPSAEDIHRVVFNNSGGLLDAKKAARAERQAWVQFP